GKSAASAGNGGSDVAVASGSAHERSPASSSTRGCTLYATVYEPVAWLDQTFAMTSIFPSAFSTPKGNGAAAAGAPAMHRTTNAAKAIALVQLNSDCTTVRQA